MAETRGVDPRPVRTQFASDNWSGLCPEAMKALIEANEGFMAPYGSDLWTQKACDALSMFFETKVQVFFLPTGTAANALALAQLTLPTGAVVCHPFAHIRTDECGAPGFLNPGMGLIPGDGPQGKIAPASLSAILERSEDLRHQPPKVLSLTQTTEVGTLYSLEELEALTQSARAKQLKIHMDGARFMNAVVALNRSPADITWRLGVNALALGASKNGGGYGDAIIFFNSDIANDFGYRVKQGGHLSAKMRLLAAPFLGLLEKNVWRENAGHANHMAQRLATRLKTAGVPLAFPSEANMVFVRLSKGAQGQLNAKGWVFNRPLEHGAARFVCGWNADPKAVDLLAQDIVEAVQDFEQERP